MSGKFSFRSLEPGRYKLRAWSEKTDEPTTIDVVIKPESNTVAVSLSGKAVGAGTDKFGVPRGKAP